MPDITMVLEKLVHLVHLVHYFFMLTRASARDCFFISHAHTRNSIYMCVSDFSVLNVLKREC